MTHVFLSYRRSDTAAAAGRVYDHLKLRLGVGRVFKDVYSMSAGKDFRDHAHAELEQADVVLVFIGEGWPGAAHKHARRRLDDADDPVRREIEHALERRIPLIPVLVEGEDMPSEAELPPSLAPLAYLHATRLRDADFDYDFGRLCDSIAAICGDLDRRPLKRRVLWISCGVALAMSIAAIAIGPERLRIGSEETSGLDVAALEKRLNAVENDATELRSQLLSLRGGPEQARVAAAMRHVFATGSVEAFPEDFRATVDPILSDGALGDDEKGALLIPAVTESVADLDRRIEKQARRVEALEGRPSPDLDVEALKLKRLIDQRSQMFELQRQILDNQTAKGIIDSIGR